MDTDLFTNTPMSSRTERLIRTIRSLTNCSEPEINLLSILVSVLLQRRHRNAFRIIPTIRLPFIRGLPDLWILLSEERGGEDVVASRYNISSITGSGSEVLRNGSVIADTAHDTVDRRVHTEGFTNNRIEDGEVTEVFISERAEFSWLTEDTKVLDLFLVQNIAKDA
jgi:hypothetical protein